MNNTSIFRSFFTLLFLLCVVSFINAQSATGYVLSKTGEPIPFANIFVKQIQSGTSANFEGKYYLGLPAKGEYDFVVSAVGYESLTYNLNIEEEDIIKDFKLEDSNIELEEIVVKASKRDPAYAIIQQVIDNKKDYLASIKSFKTNVYVKAKEEIKTIDKKGKKPRKEEKDELVKLDSNGEPEDPFETAKKEAQEEQNKFLASLNLVEMEVEVNYQFPKKYREERTAYKLYGSKHGLFIPRFEETDFNFYRNMVQLEGIAEVPLISPISRTSILSYKYKLIESKEENGLLVHKIKVIPKKVGNATCSGHIYINEGIWNINRLDFNFSKGGLKFFDAFRLKQDYEKLADGTWIPTRQEMIYETKEGKSKTFKGNTTLLYSDYQNNFEFPEKFFGSEVVVTTKDAYEKDSLYWNNSRPEPLTSEEVKLVQIRDSIEVYHDSPAYKDSMQLLYNKVKPVEVLWEGIGFRDYTKKQELYIGSIPNLLNFEVVGGWRLGPYVSWFRRWENGKVLRTSINPDIGLKNKDLQGDFDIWFRYNPHKLASIYFEIERNFASINPYDAFINQLSVSNYILHNAGELRHRFEIVNGLYLYTSFSLSDRKSITNLDSYTFLNNLIENQPEPLDFDPFQAFITHTNLSYTPGQKFMTEPNRKIVLSSKWPTFSVEHKKGWNGILGSDINFDYLEFGIQQDVTFGTFGNSKYTLISGQFLNTKDLRFIDLKRFRESDPILYSGPLHSFQSLDTALTTANIFIEAHHIHHFNGALINNIPLLKKTRIRTVLGGGFLYVKDINLRHEEVFLGLERIFKLGARRRLRLGVYGVVANSNISQADTNWKISIDVIDTWSKDWSF